MRKKSPPPFPHESKVEVFPRGWRCEKKAPGAFLLSLRNRFNFAFGGEGAFFSHQPVPKSRASSCGMSGTGPCLLHGGDDTQVFYNCSMSDHDTFGSVRRFQSHTHTRRNTYTIKQTHTHTHAHTHTQREREREREKERECVCDQRSVC